MPERFVHLTPDIGLDVTALYEELDEKTADDVRSALLDAIAKVKRNQLDYSLIKPYGSLGSTFSIAFHPKFLVTYRIETYRDEQKRPTEEHFYLKNLIRKK